MITGIDRAARLLTDHSVIGIDYLYVDTASQTALDVPLHLGALGAQQAALTAGLVSITATWAMPRRSRSCPSSSRPSSATSSCASTPRLLHVHALQPCTSPTPSPLRNCFDPYFASIDFSFKAGCYSDVDCDHSGHHCAAEPTVDFPSTTRRATSGASAPPSSTSPRSVTPGGRPLEADAAVMAGRGHVGTRRRTVLLPGSTGPRGYLETATQRRSIRRQRPARRLPHPRRPRATTWIDVKAKAAARSPRVPRCGRCVTARASTIRSAATSTR